MFERKKILILGLARSGYEAAKFLAGRENEIVLNDFASEDKLNSSQVEDLRNLGVTLIFGGHPDDLLDTSFDYLIKNPGIRSDHKYVQKAKELGIPVINEVEMAYRLLPQDVTLIGITGSNGKTTTTTLTYEMIRKSGKRVHLAGNIGYPLCGFLDQLQSGDIIVMEVSCQQLANVDQFKPHIAVMTNLSPAHIDFFGSYDAYKRVKARIFQHQTSEDIAILNIENEDVLQETKTISSKIQYFSSQHQINGCYYQDGSIYYYDEKIMDRKDFFLVGNHNVENAMAAIMTAKLIGVSNEDIVSVLKNFKGVEHRLEFIDEVEGRRFYNDTEATNIKSTQIALSSFEQPTILFLGGLERGQDFSELTDYLSHVKAILAIGQCRQRVQEFGEKNNIPTYSCEFLKDAFPKAYEISEENDIVLLSPASASWDQYKECEIRGAEFKSYVKDLKKQKTNSEN